MNNLFIVNEYYTNGYTHHILDILSILSILAGVAVIISKNPIISILFLIGLFANISVYLIVIGLSFIGLSYLIVYIGAVSMLFLFILMLINIRVSELQSETSNSIPLGAIIIIFFTFTLSQILPQNMIMMNNYNYFDYIFNNNDFIINEKKTNVFFVTSKIWDGSLGENNHITSIGNIMYTSYNMWLILASFILLLAMVGAIVITIKQK